MLDTNVAIALRDGDDQTEQQVRALGDDLCISIVTRIELQAGLLETAPRGPARRARLDAVLATVAVIDLGAAAADAYGEIIATMGFSRSKILDRMIAAQAVAFDATLVTRNAVEFRNVPRLKLLAW